MFEYAPDIKVGDVFTRIDRNGTTWKAEVVNRTELFVDVKNMIHMKENSKLGFMNGNMKRKYLNRLLKGLK